MKKRFKDKVIIITGGASGIGKTAALEFGLEGAQVIIWDINQTKTSETEEEFKRKNILVEGMYMNTTDPEETQNTAKYIKEKYGSIDVLINNAGITRDATIKKMQYNEWQQVLDVNLTGVFNCTKSVIPYMIEQESGRIINTSSVVGLYGNFGQANYSATKSGLIGFTKTLAKELGKYKITVNAVAPGFIATEMVAAMPSKVVEMMVSKTPLRRLGTPEDVAHVYSFLASEEASFVSGSVISVDGAVTL
ncbi:3-oxoacyl-ACP reductase FabG [Chondrinema litorale]|uniref:3-oxoacyl-ACP reductase FabG n=1 Tax=Chondrinema litorale TaxID=2994555 RepID=UPI002542D522|nr:3-oxoacyl-ACP reductase FabG [Chondrinema litorale]UZR97898.1 3-oxoacyl-ACP reductase FabG [Chondrinema litorale]